MKVRIAILDLYEGVANEGMRCIDSIIAAWAQSAKIEVEVQRFEVRIKQEIPPLSFDLFISSGGPGSPLSSEGEAWENKYFRFIDEVSAWNASAHYPKKPVFFICHSFQLACRHFGVATVTRRKSSSFGIFPVHLTEAGKGEKIFEGLENPFFVVDNRDYQVVKPNHERLEEMGGNLLAIEKERPHVPLERGVMAIRFNENFLGTQFHPEADPLGMSRYLDTPEKKQSVIDNYGIEKWNTMVAYLQDATTIAQTQQTILPNFLNRCLKQLRKSTAAMN